MDAQRSAKFVVVAGGVISGVGKGVVSASIGKILKEHGYKTTLIKIDPYINYDAGTLRPTEHGEVWVTGDGGEIDQDLGTYERFIDEDIPKSHNITTGQIYKSVIDRERRGEYLGQTVQFMPHIIDEIVSRIMMAAQGYDFVVVEVGGTVGDYENAPFLFALKALEQQRGPASVGYVLVTYLPIPSHINEMKTRPTRQSMHMLGEHCIIPDFIMCRASVPLDDVRKQKIREFAYLPLERIISVPDVSCVYETPLELERQRLGDNLLTHFGLQSRKRPEWQLWRERVGHIQSPSNTVRVAIIGKYLDTGDFSLTDSYVSICHALIHAGANAQVSVEIAWLDAKKFEHDEYAVRELALYDGILVPGGFGSEGVAGKIRAIEYARVHRIPYLGLCYGMQLAAVEFARNVCGLDRAHTTEVDPQTPYPVIDILPLQRALLEKNCYGGTMRLGSYQARLLPESKVHQLYNNSGRVQYDHDVAIATERHRHRYEVNPAFVPQLEKAGIIFSGFYHREDGTKLAEFIELADHPFFVATQAHPEFTSRFGSPNPLFAGFVTACCQSQETKKDSLSKAQRTHHHMAFDQA